MTCMIMQVVLLCRLKVRSHNSILTGLSTCSRKVSSLPSQLGSIGERTHNAWQGGQNKVEGLQTFK